MGTENEGERQKKIYPPNPYTQTFIDAVLHPPASPGGGERPRWRHTCTACEQREGVHNDWDFCVCEECLPGLSDVLGRAFEEYRARRQQEGQS